MERPRSPRRKPFATRRALQRATTFQDAGSEALVQRLLASYAARAGPEGLAADSQEAIRRAIADRVASLAEVHGHLPPRALTLRAINSFARPTEPASMLAESSRPREPFGKAASNALKRTLHLALEIGLGPLTRLAGLVVMLRMQFVGSLRQPGAADLPAVPAPVDVLVRVPVLEGGARGPPSAVPTTPPHVPMPVP